ncbi:MAG: LacI family DNA-binding transcriptional regulator, partial [Planctomycetota bacterium]
MSTDSVTIYDVADVAGVSPRTVSRYLNHPEKLAAATRERIANIVEELGYRPNVYANRVSSGEQSVLAVLAQVNDQASISPLHRLLLGHISCKLASLGKDMLLIGVNPENEARVIEESIRRNKFDALLILTNLSPALTEELAQSPFPKVTINWEPTIRFREHAYVGIDYFDSSRTLTQALLEKGYRHIGYVEPSLKEGLSIRGEAAVETIKRFGRKARHSLFRLSEWNAPDDAVALAEEICALDDRPDCLYCYSDLTAISLMNALQRKGIQVPEEMAIVGFDGIESTTWTSPQLSTAAQPWKAMAET